MRYDTTVSLILNYAAIDSQRSFGRLTYSFFDTENDSCRLDIALLDRETQKKISPDSITGDVVGPPATDRSVSFFYHGIYDYSMISTIITLKQLKNEAAVSETLFTMKSLGDTDLVTTDTALLRQMNGTWKSTMMRFDGVTGKRNWTGGFTDNTNEYIIHNDTATEYSGSTVKWNCRLEVRKGWSFSSHISSKCIHGGAFTLISPDTLISLCGYITNYPSVRELIVYCRTN
jgi:hypothetical protein